MRYRIKHRTGFAYDGDATASYNEVRMLPLRDEYQVVFSSKLDIRPHPASHEYADYFGTRVLVFEVLELHATLEIEANSTVEVRSRDLPVAELTWSELKAAVEKNLELTDAALQTFRTQIPADLVKFARKAASDKTISQTAAAIVAHVHDKMEYRPGSTAVHSVASEAWSKKLGVCQDFAHLTIGALRAVGIPARYVSGYLHPKPKPEIGQAVVGESHAWVEWWCGSWQSADPTNAVAVRDRHILVGRGRDYDDVPPLRGVYAGSSGSELFVSVEITREA